jgi:hypothetical protein
MTEISNGLFYGVLSVSVNKLKKIFRGRMEGEASHDVAIC